MKIRDINDNIVNIIFLLIFTANLAITKAFGRGFLLQEILIITLLILNIIFNRSKKFYLILFLLITIPCILNIVNLFDIEFLKTYILFVIYSMFVMIVTSVKNKELCIKYYLFGIKILVYFGIIQFIVRLFGIEGLTNLVNNIFGDYTMAENLQQSSFYGIPRINSLLYEPSIFGLTCLSGVGVAIYLKEIKSIYYNKKYFILSVIGVILSFSATAIMGLVIVIFTRLILIKNNPLIKYVTTVCAFLFILVGINLFLTRFTELNTPGTSGYYRIISPIMLIKRILSEGYIFGIGMGQLEKYIFINEPICMMKFGANGWGLGYTIDNVPSMLIITFGIAIIPILIYLIMYIYKKINSANIPIVIAFIIVSMGTGGYNFVYFNIVFSLMILTLKHTNNCKGENCFEDINNSTII